jgi:hypothetical protein
MRGVVVTPAAFSCTGVVAAIALGAGGRLIGGLVVEYFCEFAMVGAVRNMILRRRTARAGQGMSRRKNLGIGRHTCHGNDLTEGISIAPKVCKPRAIGAESVSSIKSIACWHDALLSTLRPGTRCLIPAKTA